MILENYPLFSLKQQTHQVSIHNCELRKNLSSDQFELFRQCDFCKLFCEKVKHCLIYWKLSASLLISLSAKKSTADILEPSYLYQPIDMAVVEDFKRASYLVVVQAYTGPLSHLTQACWCVHSLPLHSGLKTRKNIQTFQSKKTNNNVVGQTRLV